MIKVVIHVFYALLACTCKLFFVLLTLGTHAHEGYGSLFMSALTQLHTKSTFDRLLDAKLREEEKTIPILRPDSNKYK